MGPSRLRTRAAPTESNHATHPDVAIGQEVRVEVVSQPPARRTASPHFAQNARSGPSDVPTLGMQLEVQTGEPDALQTVGELHEADLEPREGPKTPVEAWFQRRARARELKKKDREQKDALEPVEGTVGEPGDDDLSAIDIPDEPQRDKASGGPPTSVGTAELDAWSAQSQAAVDQIPEPPAPSGGGRAAVQKAGKKTAKKQKKAAEKVPEKAEKAVKKPEVKELADFSAGDPANIQHLLDAQSKLRLPSVKLPNLETKSPQGYQPQLGKPPLGPPPPDTQSELDKKGSQAGPKVKSQGTKVVDKLGKGPDKLDQKKPGEGVTLDDKGPLPEFKVPKELVADVGDVLATLYKDVQSQARAFIKSARAVAYPNDALNAAYPNLGDDGVGEEARVLREQLTLAATQAGLTEDKLKERVANLGKKVKTDQDAAKKDLDKADDDARKDLKEAGDERDAALGGAVKGLKDYQERQEAIAKGDGKAVVERQRDEMLQEVTDHVAKKLIQYRSQGRVRRGQLGAARGAYNKALKDTLDADKKKLFDAAGTDADKKAAAQKTYKKSETWYAEERVKLKKPFDSAEADVTPKVQAMETAIHGAGQEAKKRIRTWSDRKTGKLPKSWWQRLVEWITDWSEQAEADRKAFDIAEANDRNQAIVGDLAFLAAVRSQAGDQLDVKKIDAIQGISAEQKMVLKAFYGEGDAKGNSIKAVAVGMRERLMKSRKGPLVQKLQREVEKKAPLPSEASSLTILARAESPGINSYTLEQRADDLYKAFDGMGTTESLVFKALGGLTKLGGKALAAVYHRDHKEALQPRLTSEMKDDAEENDRAQALLEGKQVEAEAAELAEAMNGLGTDEDVIWRVLRNKTEAERKQLAAVYKRMYGVDLNDRMSSELSSHDLDRKDALWAGDTEKADAIALDQTMHGGFLGLGTDEDGIKAIYEQNRKELEAQAEREGWTTSRLEEEIRKRNGKIEAKYDEKYAKNGGMTLKESYADELSGGQKLLADALHEGDVTKIDAARLRIEKEGIFYSDDDVINNVLEHQYERAKTDKLRDLKSQMAVQEELFLLREGRPMTPEEKKKLEKDWEKQAETYAKTEGAKKNMDALRGEYAKSSKLPWDTLDTLVVYNTSGVSGERAEKVLEQNGYLEPHQKIEYAIKGAGTDEDTVKEELKGKSLEEIREMADKWGANQRPPLKGQAAFDAFKRRVLSEFSGREHFDVEERFIYGDPKDPDKKLAMLKARAAHEGGGLSSLWTGHEQKLMESRIQRAEEANAALKNIEDENSPEYKRARATFDYATKGVESAIELHRHASDAVTDFAATVAGIVATVVVIVIAVVIAVASAGTATPVSAAIGGALTSAWVAGGAALAGGLATVAVKAAMKGSDYGWEEMGLDFAVAGVDAIASAATAGLGGKLLKAGILGKMAAKGTGARMAAHGIAEGAEGFLGSLPSAFVSSAGNDANYKDGNGLFNVLAGTAMGAGIGTLMGGGMGALGGIAKPKPNLKPKASSFDLLQFRGTPKERLKLWKAHKAQNPGADMKTFLRELDELILKQQVAGAGKKGLQRQIRGEVMQLIPDKLKRRFSDVPIEVLSEADWKKFAGEGSGSAITAMRKGKPTLVVRAGAALDEIGDEAMHLIQSTERKSRKLMGALDEKKLAGWERFSPRKKLGLYRKKVLLEIDAQERMIRTAREKLAEGGLSKARREALERQLARAQRGWSALTKRLAEIDDPTIRRQIIRGQREAPFLRRKPRLFSKDTPTRGPPLLLIEPGQVVDFGRIRRAMEALTRGDLHPEELARLLSGTGISYVRTGGLLVPSSDLLKPLRHGLLTVDELMGGVDEALGRSFTVFRSGKSVWDVGESFRRLADRLDVEFFGHGTLSSKNSSDHFTFLLQKIGLTPDEFGKLDVSKKMQALGGYTYWRDMTETQTKKVARMLHSAKDEVAFEKWWNETGSPGYGKGKRLSPFSGLMVEPRELRKAADSNVAPAGWRPEPPDTIPPVLADLKRKGTLTDAVLQIKQARQALLEDADGVMGWSRESMLSLAKQIQDEVGGNASAKLSQDSIDKLKSLLTSFGDQKLAKNPILKDAWERAEASVTKAGASTEIGQAVARFKTGKDEVAEILGEIDKLRKDLDGLTEGTAEYKSVQRKIVGASQDLTEVRHRFYKDAAAVYSAVRSKFGENMQKLGRHFDDVAPGTFDLTNKADLDFLYKPVPSYVEVHHLLYKKIFPELALDPRNLLLALRNKETGGDMRLHDLLHFISAAGHKDKFNELAPQIAALLYQELIR